MTSFLSFSSHPSSTSLDRLCHAPLPRGLREKAGHLSWDRFLATYGHRAGPVQLQDWQCTDGRGSSRGLGAQARHYQATLTVGGRTETICVSATGPIAALTAMLYELGIALEVLDFHQLQMGRDTVTFIRGTAGVGDEWAMAWAEDNTHAALRAVIACANALAGPE
ncbi:MAG: homocitrate synthase [Mycobacterium sp.]